MAFQLSNIDFQMIGSVAMVGAGLFGLVKMGLDLRDRTDEKGSGPEKKLLKSIPELFKAIKNTRQAQKNIKKIKKEEKNEGKQEIKIDKELIKEAKKAGHGDKVTKDEGKFMKDVAKAVKDEEKEDIETAEVSKLTISEEGHVIGLEAETESTEKVIEEEEGKDQEEVKNEVHEEAEISQLAQKIDQLTNNKQIDQVALNHISNYVGKMVEDMKAEVTGEEGKEKRLQTVTKRIKDSSNAIKKTLASMLRLDKRIAKHEQKRKKFFDKEVKKIEDAIKDKEKEMKDVLKQNKKGADSNIVSKIKQQIKVLTDQAKAASLVNNKLKQAHNKMGEIITTMRIRLVHLRKDEKTMLQVDAQLTTDVTKIKSEVKVMKDSYNNMKKGYTNFKKSSVLTAIALNLSKDLKAYDVANETVGKSMASINKDMGKITEIEYKMEFEAQAVDRMLQALMDTEKMLVQADKFMAKIMEGVVGKKPLQMTEEEIEKTLDELNPLLNYEENISKWTDQRMKHFAERLKIVHGMIIKMAAYDLQHSEYIKKQADQLGNIMADIVNRKVELGNMTVHQAEHLADDIGKYNSQAGKAFNKARWSSVKAAAA